MLHLFQRKHLNGISHLTLPKEVFVPGAEQACFGMFSNPTTMKTVSNIFTANKSDYYKLDLRLPLFERDIK